MMWLRLIAEWSHSAKRLRQDVLNFAEAAR
jgi:hypothetical protein